MANLGSIFRLAETAQDQGMGRHAVKAAIQRASSRTGVDFSYLMVKAAQESGFDPDAKAATSSATGLYQFIDRTWLEMVEKHGAKHGLAQYADAVTRGTDGRPVVADPELRREILDLRKDPAVSAVLAAEFARDNQRYLEGAVGGEIGATELYMAHFLGAGGAAKFLNALRADPTRAGADLLPEAASANRAVFFDRTGAPRSVAEIYDRFAAKFGADTAGLGVAEPGAADHPGPYIAPSRQRQSPGMGDAPFQPFARRSVPPPQPLSLFTVLVLAGLDVPTTPERSGPQKDGEQRRAPSL